MSKGVEASNSMACSGNYIHCYSMTLREVEFGENQTIEDFLLFQGD